MSEIAVDLPSAGIRLAGWKSARVTRSVENLTGAFELSMSDVPDEVRDALVDAMPAHVAIDGDRILTGYVDAVDYALSPREHGLTVIGRGLCQDLIDCSGTGGVSPILANTRIDDVCRRFVQSLGTDEFGRIAVTMTPALQAQIDALPPIPFQLVSPMETPWEIIERCCRYSAVLAYEAEDGSLTLAIAGDEVGSSGVALGQNVEAATVLKSEIGRYSKVSAYLNNFNNALDIGVNLKPAFTSGDPALLARGRYRPHAFLSEQPASDQTYLQRRVMWQIARAYGRSRQIRVLVDSWHDATGEPWRLNRQIPVSLPRLKVPDNTLLLVTEVTFILDEHGTHAELLLMPREGLLPEPLVLQRIDPDLAA
jgi:prophage tail gpP-like protein